MKKRKEQMGGKHCSSPAGSQHQGPRHVSEVTLQSANPADLSYHKEQRRAVPAKLYTDT